MKFYYIWTKLFNFEFKNTNKIEIKIWNMSPKNAIKIINIQKFYSVHFGLIRSTLVLFSPFSPHWFYSMHFKSVRSKLVQFGPFCPLWFYLVDVGPILSTSVLLGPIWSYSVLFVPIRSITLTLVLICPFVLTRSHSVHFRRLWSNSVYSVKFGPFSPFHSTLVHFIQLSPFWSIPSNSVHWIHFGLFGPIWSNRSNSAYLNGKIQVWVESTINYLSNINCNYII